MASPRMRTISEAHAALMAADPDCCLTMSALRRLVRSGAIRSIRIGAKYLLDLSDVEGYLVGSCQSTEPPATPITVCGIRRLGG